MTIEKLVCAVQNYEWGRIGESSFIAQLKKSADSNFIIENKPYAELWMGVHSNGPSVIESTGEQLSEFITSNRSVLGEHENGTLQFLFKVLSVNKALSIQAHPDKERAKLLREKDPSHYPDDNHKPEMAIALDDFQLLCGFRQAEEIYENMKNFPELHPFINDTRKLDELKDECKAKRKECLKKIFSLIMNSKAEEISAAVDSLITRLKKKNSPTQVDLLMMSLNDEFPGDVGVFAPLLLNYFILKKGQAVFLGPNQPHAYLYGNCIECMACSDNTIRAGLTPKFKDVETLCSSLTFEMTNPAYFEPTELDTGVRQYSPPASEFTVHEIKHGAKTLSDVKASSILLIISGYMILQLNHGSKRVNMGEILFIPANIGTVHIETDENCHAYRAFTPH